MPHAAVGLTINLVESGCIRQGLRQVSIASFRNDRIQVLAGLCLNGMMLTLFLGSELDTFLDKAQGLVGTSSISGAETIKTVQEFNQGMNHLPLLVETTESASWLADQRKDHINPAARFESGNTGRGMEIFWTDGVPLGEIFTVGTLSVPILLPQKLWKYFLITK